MKNQKFEKRRKGVEKLFDIIFWLIVIEFVASIFFKVAYLTGNASVDIVSVYSLIAYLIAGGLMYYCTRLAHQGKQSAGVIGIIIAVLELASGEIISTIIGILLLIDSIMYLVNYNKK